MSGLARHLEPGVLAGALLGSLSAHAGIDPRVQFTVTAAVAAVCGAVACPGSPEGGPSAPRRRWRCRGSPGRTASLLIGPVGFASVFVEFAANDWSAVFMHWVLHANQAEAALATGVFAGSMAAGRLCGDALVRRIGAGPSRACGVLGAVGCILVAVTPSALVALAYFMLIGLGVFVVVLLVFAAAGRSGPSPAIGVAGVATVSYGAGMAAPSVMGGVADLSSLRIAFAVAAVLAGAIVAGGGLLDREHRSAGAQQEPAAEPAQ